MPALQRRLLLLVACLVLGAGCSATVYGSHQQTIQKSSSGKYLAIYADASFEPNGRRDIPQADIDRTMRATGFFTADDVRELGPALKTTLGSLAPNQRAVIVGVGALRPPRYHIAVQGNDLVVMLYHGNNSMSRHASSIGHGNAGFVHAQPEPAQARPPVTTPEPKPPVVTPKPNPKPRGEKLSPEEVRKRLTRLQELKDQGLISDEDYERKRKTLIEQL